MSLRLTKSVVIRIVRTALMSFIGVYGAANLVSVAGGSSAFNISVAKSAAATALITVVSALWNVALDPSPVPSLDPEKPAAPSAPTPSTPPAA